MVRLWYGMVNASIRPIVETKAQEEKSYLERRTLHFLRLLARIHLHLVQVEGFLELDAIDNVVAVLSTVTELTLHASVDRPIGNIRRVNHSYAIDRVHVLKIIEDIAPTHVDRKLVVGARFLVDVASDRHGGGVMKFLSAEPL